MDFFLLIVCFLQFMALLTVTLVSSFGVAYLLAHPCFDSKLVDFESSNSESARRPERPWLLIVTGAVFTIIICIVIGMVNAVTARPASDDKFFVILSLLGLSLAFLAVYFVRSLVPLIIAFFCVEKMIYHLAWVPMMNWLHGLLSGMIFSLYCLVHQPDERGFPAILTVVTGNRALGSLLRECSSVRIRYPIDSSLTSEKVFAVVATIIALATWLVRRLSFRVIQQYLSDCLTALLSLPALYRQVSAMGSSTIGYHILEMLLTFGLWSFNKTWEAFRALAISQRFIGSVKPVVVTEQSEPERPQPQVPIIIIDGPLVTMCTTRPLDEGSSVLINPEMHELPGHVVESQARIEAIPRPVVLSPSRLRPPPAKPILKRRQSPIQPASSKKPESEPALLADILTSLDLPNPVDELLGAAYPDEPADLSTPATAGQSPLAVEIPGLATATEILPIADQTPSAIDLPASIREIESTSEPAQGQYQVLEAVEPIPLQIDEDHASLLGDRATTESIKTLEVLRTAPGGVHDSEVALHQTALDQKADPLRTEERDLLRRHEAGIVNLRILFPSVASEVVKCATPPPPQPAAAIPMAESSPTERVETSAPLPDSVSAAPLGETQQAEDAQPPIILPDPVAAATKTDGSVSPDLEADMVEFFANQAKDIDMDILDSEFDPTYTNEEMGDVPSLLLPQTPPPQPTIPEEDDEILSDFDPNYDNEEMVDVGDIEVPAPPVFVVTVSRPPVERSQLSSEPNRRTARDRPVLITPVMLPPVAIPGLHLLPQVVPTSLPPSAPTPAPRAPELPVPEPVLPILPILSGDEEQYAPSVASSGSYGSVPTWALDYNGEPEQGDGTGPPPEGDGVSSSELSSVPDSDDELWNI